MEAISEIIKGQPLNPEHTHPPKVEDSESSELKSVASNDWDRCDPETIAIPEAELEKFKSEYRRREAAKINQIRYLAHIRQQQSRPLYSAEELFYWIQDTQGVELDEHNEKIVQGLSLYFTRDARFEDWFDEPMSLQKGILLMGNIGCGKTYLMQAFQFNPIAAFAVKACRTIADEYKQDGIPGIQKHARLVTLSNKNPFTGSDQFGWCFDDLGTEEIANHFGDKRNVMEQVLLSCYDRSELRGKVHATTNLTGDEIEGKYGLRVRSRMRELFNLIEFPENAIDRRA